MEYTEIKIKIKNNTVVLMYSIVENPGPKKILNITATFILLFMWVMWAGYWEADPFSGEQS